MKRAGKNSPLHPPFTAKEWGGSLTSEGILVPSTGCKASGAAGPRAGRAEPKLCDRAREPPCCWRQQLSDEPRTKNPPHL